MIKSEIVGTIGLLFFCTIAGVVLHFECNPPLPPAAQKMSIYLPPRAEFYSWEQVQAESSLSSGFVHPFQIQIPISRFQELLASSAFAKPIVTYRKLGGDWDVNSAVVYDYWLDRGNGAWFHAQSELLGPKWGLWFRNQWQKVDDSTWIAQPVYSPSFGQFLVCLLALGGLWIFFTTSKDWN